MSMRKTRQTHQEIRDEERARWVPVTSALTALCAVADAVGSDSISVSELRLVLAQVPAAVGGTE